MRKKTYEKPALTKMENLRDITFECPDFTCSITGIDQLPIPTQP